MKKQDRIISVKFAGSGHYKVTIERYGKQYTGTITHMPDIDDYKDGKIKAAIAIYDTVMRQANHN
jgi:hypothetical protein